MLLLVSQKLIFVVLRTKCIPKRSPKALNSRDLEKANPFWSRARNERGKQLPSLCGRSIVTTQINHSMHKLIRMSLCTMSAIGKGSPNARLLQVMEQLRRTPGSTFLLDGGTGEELFTKIPDDRKIWAATAVVNEKYHGALKDVHRSFLRAGAQAITTVYGITPGVGFIDDEIVQHCATAGRLAREVIEEEKSSAFVFGSLGALVESYRADMILDHDRGTAVYRKSAEALADFTDAFLAETLSCVEEAFQAIEAVKDIHQPLLVSFTVDGKGNLRSGEKIAPSLQRVVKHCKDNKVKRTSFCVPLLSAQWVA